MLEKDKILLVTDDASVRERCRKALARRFLLEYQERPSVLCEHPAPIVIVDEALCKTIWLPFRQPKTTYLFLVHDLDSPSIDLALKNGVQHFLLWPLSKERILFSLKIALFYDKEQQLLLRHMRKFKKMAERDSLTQVYSRSILLEHAAKLFSQAKHFRMPLSVAMIDIDRFKETNDLYGHAAGDRVLHHFGQILLRSLRTTDLVGRYGGEEFLVLLPNTTSAQALGVAKKLVRLVENEAFALNAHTSYITISVGVAAITPETEDLDILIQQADKALYLAKRKGRNQAALFSE